MDGLEHVVRHEAGIFAPNQAPLFFTGKPMHVEVVLERFDIFRVAFDNKCSKKSLSFFKLSFFRGPKPFRAL